MASVPLIYLKDQSLLPDKISKLNQISIYSQKSKCIDFINSILNHDLVSNEVNGKFILKDELVASALDLTEDIMRFFDKLYIAFPTMYNKVSPGFGRIGCVKDKEKHTLFRTTEKAKSTYPPAFIYPLIAGLRSLMQIKDNKLSWIISPLAIDLMELNLEQYVGAIRLVKYDPQKIGKQELFYQQSKSIFDNYLLGATVS